MTEATDSYLIPTDAKGSVTAGLTSHPLIAHKMTVLRNADTVPHDFRRTVKEMTFYLGYEATRHLTSASCEVVTSWDIKYTGHKIADKVAIIPILRAGLCMADAMLELLPTAAVHHIGMYHAKNSSLPVQYYNRLPKDSTCDIAFICDVCISTGISLLAVISIVKKWGAKKIVVIAVIGTVPGIDKIKALHPDVHIVVGGIDEQLSPNGHALPGIGDAGDRLFGTPIEEDNAFLATMTPLDNGVGSARKRSRSIVDDGK
mmetsp:Transcript_33906/g.34539  ORF Transcript_33906/g.34539 Transcript_33906/m.34539 type:complete len:259 (+) Transcript_33906:107-883(+)